jgi:hypothetical protein
MDRAARRRGDSPQSRWRQPLLLLGGSAAILEVAAFLVFMLVRAGGDDAEADPASTDNGGPQPQLSGPASKFAASAAEIGGGIQGVPPDSFEVTSQMYTDPQVGPFGTTEEGVAKVAEWDYREGYIGSFDPDGLVAGLVQGRYFVRIETHLFGTSQGAAAAFAHYNELYASIDGLAPEDVTPLANQTAGWTSLGEKIGSTDLDEVYHRVIFRRGNLLAIVQTVGADTFMTIDPARNIAAIVDERALGSRAAPTPTPSGGTLPPSPVPTR